jgi:ribulose bisphosphate carboxylase small subunit
MPIYKDIRKDATIREVLPTLLRKEEYLRVVIGHMSECKKQHQNAFVRIGVTGQGKVPSHKIVYDNPDGKETFFKAWGEETLFTDVKIHESTWSTARMSWEEVRDLLGEIRGFKPK